MDETLICSSADETRAFGQKLGAQLTEDTLVCLRGDLGAGKTTLCRGLVQGVTGQAHAVTSPTFVYLNIYEGKLPVYHFDLYRLHDADEFLGMGFDEFFEAGGICCVEWSERIEPLLPTPRVEIHLSAPHPEQRRIEVRQMLS